MGERVEQHPFQCHATADPQREADGGVEVRAADEEERVGHRRNHEAHRQRRQDADEEARQRHGERDEECADELADQLRYGR